MENERNLDKLSNKSANPTSQKKARPQIQMDAERKERIRKLLEESKAKIRACDELIGRGNSVTIRVLKDGRISVPRDSGDFRPDDSGYRELLRELTIKKECRNLKFIELRTLARLLRIVKNSEYQIKVICDDPEFEKSFLALSIDRQSN